MSTGIILYGPPASGKDSITEALGYPFQLFKRIKVGPGRTCGYRMHTEDQLRAMRGDVLYLNRRYDATYVIDRSGIEEALAEAVPVVHLGQLDGVRALSAAGLGTWMTVRLECRRDTTRARAQARGDRDVAARLAAWDATAADLATGPDLPWHLVVDTERHSPADAASMVRGALQTDWPSTLA
ncbi:guanylate kinase [Streptomyces otsuchiensis]|uniref:guanylate kinase n=1 Tax=Streptomyces otsuchiensis TaxID=2681388 RepID=UPI0010303A4B|nr:guanylate kinase [Streptomyces otsuchiensis]